MKATLFLALLLSVGFNLFVAPRSARADQPALPNATITDLPVSGVYNVGTGTAVSFMDVARQVASETGAEIREIPMPKHLQQNYQPYTRADMTKTQSALKGV